MWITVRGLRGINTWSGRAIHPNFGRGHRVGANTGYTRTCAAVDLDIEHNWEGGSGAVLNCNTKIAGQECPRRVV